MFDEKRKGPKGLGVFLEETTVSGIDVMAHICANQH